MTASGPDPEQPYLESESGLSTRLPVRRETAPFVVAGILLLAVAATYYLGQLSRKELVRLSSVAGPLTTKQKDAHAALSRQIRLYEDGVVTEEVELIAEGREEYLVCQKHLKEIHDADRLEEKKREQVVEILRAHQVFTARAEEIYTRMANGDDSPEVNLASLDLAAAQRDLHLRFARLDQAIALHMRDGLADVTLLERRTIIIEIIVILVAGGGVFLFLRSVVAKPLQRLVEERTEQLHAHELELVESENRFRQLVEHMSSGVSVLEFSEEKDDFIFREANRAVATIEQLGRQELIGHTMSDLFPNIRRTKLYRALQEVHKTGEGFELEAHHYRDKRIAGWRHSFLYKLHTGEVVVVYDDITEKKEMDRKLEEMNRNLQQASLHAGMAEIASGVLHNVGNTLNSVNVLSQTTLKRVHEMPLTGLKNIATLLTDNANDLPTFIAGEQGTALPEYLATLYEMMADERARLESELEDLQGQVDHMGAVVQSQQTYARQMAVEQEVSMGMLVEDALRLSHSSLMRHDIKVDAQVEPGVEVVVQAHKVLQILVNLIQNAKDAMNKAEVEMKELSVIANRDGKDVVISVVDNGAGIAPENLGKIFTHGFTTRESGHGFGLHSCALSAKQLDGQLTADSKGIGKGACFTLRFPMHAESEDSPKQK
ncbi:hypothetical protein BVY04_05435 [bacterium M21]|nr:hypothetical protein BVY04_05435 [bacterium M21]